MLSLLFVVAREFLEAVLIVSIIYAFLHKQQLSKQGRPYLLGGVAGGVLLSGLLALTLYRLSDWLEGQGLLYFEAGLFIVSAALMTQMVFWMRRVGHRMKAMIEGDLKESLHSSGFLGIVLVTALGIGREGSEVATYIYSLSLSEQFSVTSIATACLLGVVMALVFYKALTRGMTAMSLNTFFKVTSVFLFLTAGSLLLEATARLSETGILPDLVPVVWNSSHLIAPDSWVGQSLKLLIGYRPMPSLMMVLVYVGYWALIALLYKMNPAKPRGSVQPKKMKTGTEVDPVLNKASSSAS